MPKDNIFMYTVDKSARVFIANTYNLVNEAFKIHNTTPVVTAALGRTLTATAIMGAMLKNDSDVLTVTIKGKGQIGGIVATTNNKCEVKGYVFNNHVQIPNKPGYIAKLDVSAAIGEGILTITKDVGLKEPQSGQVPLVSGEIAEDITYYYAKSEQTPSSVALGVLVNRDYTVKQAGGFIIQLLPHAKEGFIKHLENIIPTLPPITTMLENGDDILKLIFPKQSINNNGSTVPTYYCNCNRNKTQKALMAVGKKELLAILKEDKEANIHCHFCKKDYNFTENDINEIIKLV